MPSFHHEKSMKYGGDPVNLPTNPMLFHIFHSLFLGKIHEGWLKIPENSTHKIPAHEDGPHPPILQQMGPRYIFVEGMNIGGAASGKAKSEVFVIYTAGGSQGIKCKTMSVLRPRGLSTMASNIEHRCFFKSNSAGCAWFK